MSRDSFMIDTAMLSATSAPRAAHRSDRWGSALAYAAAAATLSFALVLPPSLATFAIAAALGLCCCGVLIPARAGLERHGDSPVSFVLALALVANVGSLLIGVVTPATAFPLAAGLLLAGSNLSPVRWLGRAQVPLLLCGYVVYVVLTVAEAPQVTNPLKAGAATLLSGENPYTRGYHETPVLLLFAVPVGLLGDIRYGLALSMAAAGACLAGARPGRVGAISAGLLLFLPAQLGAMRDGEVEPLITLLLAVTAYCACRFPRALPWVLGLLLASKMYLALIVPVALVLAGQKLTWRDTLRLTWKAVLVAVVVTAPFVAWNPGAFEKAMLTMAPLTGTRAPTLAAWISNQGVLLPGWVGIAVAVGTAVFALLFAPRTASGFCAGVALTCLGFFAFSAEATVAQYALVLAALYISVGATGLPGVMDDAFEMKTFGGRR